MLNFSYREFSMSDIRNILKTAEDYFFTSQSWIWQPLSGTDEKVPSLLNNEKEKKKKQWWA